MPADTQSHETDLREHLQLLWRRKWIIVLAGAVVTLVAVLIGVRQTPQYRSTAQVLLQESQVEELLSTAPQRSQASTNRVDTEIGVIESSTVREAVAAELGRQPDVDVAAKGETDIIAISATSTDPDQAAAEANTYAATYVRWKQSNTVRQFSDALDILNTHLAAAQQQLAGLRSDEEANATQIQSLETRMVSLQQQIGQLGIGQQLANTGGTQVVSEGQVPTQPFAPQPARNGALGLPLGLLLGIGLVFLFDTFDDRIRTKEDLEQLSGLPTLGMVPKIQRPKTGDRPPLIALDEPTAPAAEAFRSLRTSVKFLGIDEPIRTVLVTSSSASDGKTTTAANLAVALTQTGERVLMVAADLRRPRLHEYFGAPLTPGLTNVLLGEAPVSAAIYDVAELPGLHLLTSGPTPPNPSELLGSSHARTLFAELADRYDTVIIDSSPVLPVTDAQVLASVADAILLVVAYEATSKRGLTRTLELLQQVAAPVAGTVLNQVPASKTYGGAPYRYETYRSRSERRRRRQEGGRDDGPPAMHGVRTDQAGASSAPNGHEPAGERRVDFGPADAEAPPARRTRLP
jgi:capsular exopolysaccharide synthesis family protein